MADNAVFKDILQLVAAEPAVTTQLGTPVTARPASVHGNIRISGWNDTDGSADLDFLLDGPKGQAKVTVSARRGNSRWKLRNLDVQPQDR